MSTRHLTMDQKGPNSTLLRLIGDQTRRAYVERICRNVGLLNGRFYR
jgi:hypothetical protein